KEMAPASAERMTTRTVIFFALIFTPYSSDNNGEVAPLQVGDEAATIVDDGRIGHDQVGVNADRLIASFLLIICPFVLILRQRCRARCASRLRGNIRERKGKQWCGEDACERYHKLPPSPGFCARRISIFRQCESSAMTGSADKTTTSWAIEMPVP